jgi:glycosyltransferase involved in cell wall biosynthesis
MDIPITPTITSILVTYNHAKTVQKALESMLVQKADFPHRILIADDCSTDGTSQICLNYATRFPRQIELIPREGNLGIVHNVFDSITRVSSEFFAVLEGDDYWCDPNKLQKQVDALRAHPECSFCAHNTLSIDQNGNEQPLYTSKKHNIREKYQFPERYRKRDIVKAHPSSRVFRSACLELKDLKLKDSVVWDSSAYWYFLSKGSLFYFDEIMSVYNYTGIGAFSGSSKERQRCMALLNLLNINEELNFEHNHIFMPRILRRSKLLNLSLWNRLKLRYNPQKDMELYNSTRSQLETKLNKTS